MIAKGLDFPNVTMVGILAADAMLKLPDYRSAERTFQLLTQVAGRAAERICASPCSSNYGSLSVLVSAYADTQILRKIGPEHFTPRPNVDSATMLLTPKADALAAPEGFFDFVRAAFTQKRKTAIMFSTSSG